MERKVGPSTSPNPSLPSPPPPPPSVPELKPCQGLVGGDYTEYTLRTDTRSLGGVSTAKMGELARELFPYKPLPSLKLGPEKKGSSDIDVGDEVADNVESEDRGASVVNEIESDGDQGVGGELVIAMKHEVPDDGNRHVKQGQWTRSETKKLDVHLRVLARWEVDYDDRTVRSSDCRRRTTNESEVCDDCVNVSKDPSLKDAIRRVRSLPILFCVADYMGFNISHTYYRSYSSPSCPKKISTRSSRSDSSSRPVSCVDSITVPWRRSYKILYCAVCFTIFSATTIRGAFFVCTRLLSRVKSRSSR